MPAIAVRHGTWLDTIGYRLVCVPAALFMALRGLLSLSDPLAQLQKLEVFSFKPTDQMRACGARLGPIIHAALKGISDHENERLLSGNGRRPEHARPRGFATCRSLCSMSVQQVDAKRCETSHSIGTSRSSHRAARYLICSKLRVAGSPSRTIVARLRSLSVNVIARKTAACSFIVP